MVGCESMTDDEKVPRRVLGGARARAAAWLVASAFTAALGTTGFGQRAFAQPAATAESLNEDGKQLLYDDKPLEAAAKFRQAIAISPEGRFYYNLCVAQYQAGRFGEAIASCDSVAPNGADAALKEKATTFRAKILAEMERQGLAAPATTTPPPTDPSNPATPADPVPTASPAVGAPPPPPAPQKPNLTSKYMWSLGALIFAPKGTGFGYDDGDYEMGLGIQINSDLTLNQPLSMGLQGYISYYTLPSAYTDIDKLTAVEIGVSGYKNFCSGAVCVTPRLGILVADFAPGNYNDNDVYGSSSYQSFGVTAEVAAGLAVGAQKQGLLFLQGGYRYYAAASGDGVDYVGLDDGMSMAYIGVGYTHRFAKSWSESPGVFSWRLE